MIRDLALLALWVVALAVDWFVIWGFWYHGWLGPFGP